MPNTVDRFVRANYRDCPPQFTARRNATVEPHPSVNGIDAHPTRPRRGFGVVGSLPQDVIGSLVATAEAAGYHTFWVNDGRRGEGLAALRGAAAATTSLRLAVGAIPLDQRDPAEIAARIAALDLPGSRLIVGVGSGGAVGGLDRVRRGITTLRERTTATLVVAAMGPKMCHLAGELADGVLLDWATPTYADHIRPIVATAAGEAGRPAPWIASYVFTALGADATAKLRAEAGYYAALPSYAAHFARMDAEPLQTAAFAGDRDALQRELSRFDAVLDESVIRAVVASETIAAYHALLRAAAPEPSGHRGLEPYIDR
jgi:alkanesulfonate monooxygenase SsuD/methylene tetrahydromethanopterin reductase-like flavin-dependent oxidoreductase (luciferase family)